MKKRLFLSVLAIALMTAIFALPILNSRYIDNTYSAPSDTVSKAPVAIVPPPPKKEEDNPKKETIQKSDESVNFIIELNSESLIDMVIDGKYQSIPELVLSDDGRSILDAIKKNQAVVKASIQKLIPKSDFSESHTYCALINGFSVKAPESAKEKIKKINGIKNVLFDNAVLHEQDISDIPSTAQNISEEQLSLLNYDSSLDGQNTLIAVIDSEFDVLHEAFSVQPDTIKYDREYTKNIFNAVNFSTGSDCKFEDVFKSDKIIYAYDYADSDTDTRGNHSHGTAAAALIGGNDSESLFKGIAYNSQLALMKVCNSDGLAHADKILAALDDCAKLDTDIINISLGSENISNIFQSPFEKLTKTGTVIICPCGNYGFNENKNTYYADYGSLNYISGYENVISVASSKNPLISANYIKVDKNAFLYSDVKCIESKLAFTDITEKEYIFLYENEDGNYDFSQAENKIAVIETDLSKIQDFAQQAFISNASAIAFIDSGNFENDRNLSLEIKNIPVIIIDDDYTNYFYEHPEGVIETGENAVLTESQKGNSLSDFSSWGVTADLKLKPEIASVGEGVYSAKYNGGYEYISGTSFSSALISGTYAVIKQYLSQYEWYNSLSKEEKSKIITAFIMSNAEPVKIYDYANDELLYISPRKQGAGRADIQSVIRSGAYLCTENNGMPKASIGDGMNGKYNFSFFVRNVSQETQIFSFNHFIATDKYEVTDNKIINTFEPYSLKNFSEVRFFSDGEEVTEIEVAGGEQAELSVEIEINANELQEFFPNGFYIDGYAVLENQNGRTLNFPFMAFFGEWENINPFYEEMETEQSSLVSVDYNADSEPVKIDGYMSKNMTGNFYDIQQMKNSYILPDFRVMRDVYDFTVTVSDTNGKALFSKNFGTIGKNSGELYTNLISDSADIAEFFSNLADGEYIYSVSAKTMTSSGSLSQNLYSINYPFIMDSQKPENLSSKTFHENDETYLELTATDNELIKGFELYTSAYNSKEKKYEYADRLDDLKNAGYISENVCSLESISENADGSVTYKYNITSLYDELIKLQFMTRTSISPFSPLRIAYRAFDGAYNSTDIKIADAVTYKKAVFSFTDQNGKPAQNIKIALGDKIISSDINGNAVFENLLSDIYLAEIISLPENYSCSEKYFIAQIEKSDYTNEISVSFNGEYSEPSEEESSVPDKTENSFSEIQPEFNGDSPTYSIIFIGILVIISSVAFILNRQKRK